MAIHNSRIYILTRLYDNVIVRVQRRSGGPVDGGVLLQI